MSEIRDFLSEMVVPQLGDSGFATSFPKFCEAIKDNINKIVSAPFLKGDRGSKISFIDEPLILETNGGTKWSEFAKSLIRAIYYKHPSGGNISRIPLPLIEESSVARLVTEEDEEWPDMVVIDGGSIEIEGEQTTYYSFDIFRDMSSVPVCYDEATGKKFLFVPFYFFDGRLNYVGYLDNSNLSLFTDMSCVVFGEASYTGEDTKEDMEDPDNWHWELKTTQALPKLYYNPELSQFCWEIAGELTNIVAQGLQGDKGDAAHIWVCEGSLSGEQILINSIIDGSSGNLDDIGLNDLALVSYMETSSNLTDANSPFRIQFGPVHVYNNSKYILKSENAEIIGRLRNYSLHDYLHSIGVSGQDNLISALYTIERDYQDAVMAMWAGNNKMHYLAPISEGNTHVLSDNPPTLSNRILSILYDTVRFKKTIEVDNIVSNKGMNTNAISTLSDISGDNLKEYRLGVLCNVLKTTKYDNPPICRMGEGVSNFVVNIYEPSESDILPAIDFNAKSTTSYLYLECELILGWIPSEQAQVFNIGLSNNMNNPPLAIYRAQKYPLYVKLPVSGVVSTTNAEISLDGSSWGNSISLSGATNLSYKGMGNTGFTINIHPGMRFNEYILQSNDSNPGGRLSRYIYSDNVIEYYYEYLDTRGKLRKDKVLYTSTVEQGKTKYKWFLNQYSISGPGGLSIAMGSGAPSQPRIDNLLPFGARNISNSESKQYPLIDEKYSFLNYFIRNGQYITTTNNTGNYMWQGRILSSTPSGDPSITQSKKQDLFYINTSFYETLYPTDFNAFVVKNPDPSPYDIDSRHISRLPINSPIHVFPEGINGMMYDRVPISNDDPAWGVSNIDNQTPNVQFIVHE